MGNYDCLSASGNPEAVFFCPCGERAAEGVGPYEGRGKRRAAGSRPYGGAFFIPGGGNQRAAGRFSFVGAVHERPVCPSLARVCGRFMNRPYGAIRRSSVGATCVSPANTGGGPKGGRPKAAPMGTLFLYPEAEISVPQGGFLRRGRSRTARLPDVSTRLRAIHESPLRRNPPFLRRGDLWSPANMGGGPTGGRPKAAPTGALFYARAGREDGLPHQ